MKSSSVIYNWECMKATLNERVLQVIVRKMFPKRNIGVVSECVSILWFKYESRIINEKNYIGFNITNIYYILQIYFMRRPKLKRIAISSKMKFLRKCSPPLMKLQKQKWTLITFFSFSLSPMTYFPSVSTHNLMSLWRDNAILSLGIFIFFVSNDLLSLQWWVQF